jgi:anti-sigma B factor antagonist
MQSVDRRKDPNGADGSRLELSKGPLRLQRERGAHGQVVVEIEGELDLSCLELLDQEVGRVMATDASSVVLDLSGLEFIDSSGIQLLLQLESKSRMNGNRLRMVRGSSKVQRLLELTGADRMLPFGIESRPTGNA